MLECLKMEKMKGFHSIGIVLCCVLCSCQNEQLDQKTMQSGPQNAVAVHQRENRVSPKGDSLEQYFIELISNSIQKQGIQGDFEFLTYRYPFRNGSVFLDESRTIYTESISNGIQFCLSFEIEGSKVRQCVHGGFDRCKVKSLVQEIK